MSFDFPARRALALERLKQGHRRCATPQEQAYCLALFAQTEALWCVRRDLAVYPVYDALAMWLDEQAGLARWFPHQVEQAAQYIFKTEVELVDGGKEDGPQTARVGLRPLKR